MQCEVQRFNIVRHFIVPSTSVKRSSDLIEKYLHSIVVFNMTKFVPNKELHLRTALIFYFHLKKTAAESYRLLGEAYGEYAPSQKTCERWFQRFKIGDFDIADKEFGKPPKKYEDVELQALLNENDSQTQKQLAQQLSVSQQAVSNRL